MKKENPDQLELFREYKKRTPKPEKLQQKIKRMSKAIRYLKILYGKHENNLQDMLSI